jgi:hypothetical protein
LRALAGVSRRPFIAILSYTHTLALGSEIPLGQMFDWEFQTFVNHGVETFMSNTAQLCHKVKQLEKHS